MVAVLSVIYSERACAWSVVSNLAMGVGVLCVEETGLGDLS